MLLKHLCRTLLQSIHSSGPLSTLLLNYFVLPVLHSLVGASALQDVSASGKAIIIATIKERTIKMMVTVLGHGEKLQYS